VRKVAEYELHGTNFVRGLLWGGSISGVMCGLILGGLWITLR
jgi:hypothetical protein